LFNRFNKKKREELRLLEERTQFALDDAEKKTRSLAKRETDRFFLEKKQEILQSFLESLLEKLENADEKTYAKILSYLFEKLPVRAGKIFAPTKRLEITSRFAPPGFDVVALKDITSGFRVKSGNLELDQSFHSLLFSEYKNDLVQFLSRELHFFE